MSCGAAPPGHSDIRDKCVWIDESGHPLPPLKRNRPVPAHASGTRRLAQRYITGTSDDRLTEFPAPHSRTGWNLVFRAHIAPYGWRRCLRHSSFLCPRCRAGLCDAHADPTGLGSVAITCFYALDVGLGFATELAALPGWNPMGFYALDVGLGFATCAVGDRDDGRRRVSMPSMSGWALRRMLFSGASDLRFCGVSRGPCGKRTQESGQMGL
jgi:hypothetical protein